MEHSGGHPYTLFPGFFFTPPSLSPPPPPSCTLILRRHSLTNTLAHALTQTLTLRAYVPYG